MKCRCIKSFTNVAVEILRVTELLSSDSEDTGRINQYESFHDCSIRLWEKEIAERERKQAE